jgi:Putative oxidoreductase C terminal domain
MQRRLILRPSSALLALFMLVPWQAAQAARPTPGTDPTSTLRSAMESAYRKNNGIGFKSFDCHISGPLRAGEFLDCDAVDDEGDSVRHTVKLGEDGSARAILESPCRAFLESYAAGDWDAAYEPLHPVLRKAIARVQWTLFPYQAIDYKTDVKILAAQAWPTPISEADFRAVTGGQRFPASVQSHVKDGVLQYDCNTLVSYTLRGVHVTLNVIWDWQAPPGTGDRHYAVYRGRKAAIEVRQTKSDHYRPELYVIPTAGTDVDAVKAAVASRLAALQPTFAGVSAERAGREIHVVIPDRYRVGHEAHYAQVTRHFLSYLQDRSALPSWERPNMVAKYYVRTTGTELSRRSPPTVAPRLAPQ